MGRPVVANDHPDQREVLEASGAGLVTDLSSEGFAEAIAILLSDKAAADHGCSRPALGCCTPIVRHLCRVGQLHLFQAHSGDTTVTRVRSIYHR